MKKLLLFVSVLTFGLTSCSKDDDTAVITPVMSGNLEGRWELTHDGIVINGEEDLQEYDHLEGCTKDYTDITATTLTDHRFYNNGSGCADSASTPYNYTRSGNTITVNYDGQPDTIEILQLDSNTLKIKIAQTQYIQVYKRIAAVPDAPSLIGTWENSKEGISMNGTETLQDYQHTPGCDKDYIVITSTTATDHIFYTEGGPNCIEESTTTAYTRNGNIITIINDGEVMNAEIVQLDGQTLKLKAAETFNGQTVEYITVYTRR